jgi:hypothetical protein
VGNEVGKEYDGRVILPEGLNIFREIGLNYDQNLFTIELSSDNFCLPEKTTYMYRLESSIAKSRQQN